MLPPLVLAAALAVAATPARAATALPDWEAQTSGVDVTLGDVWCAGPDDAWIVGAGGTILHTSDGGATWDPQDSGTTGDLHAVAFRDSLHGCAAGEDGVMVTTSDGGATWTTRESRSTWGLDDLTFSSGSIAWAVGLEGAFTTQDDGLTWKRRSSGIDVDGWLRGVDFVDRWRGWAVGWDGEIATTISAGRTWKRQTSGVTANLEAVAFANSSLGLAVGDAGTVVRTTDGGSTWQALSLGVSSDLTGVDMVGAERAFIVGEEGVLLASDDGGATWERETLAGSPSLRSVSCARERSGFAAGLSGVVFAAVPGGGDLVPPHTVFEGIEDVWHNTPQAGTLGATDSGSGVALTQYRIDEGDWQEGVSVSVPAPADSSNDGVHRVDFRSTDVEGNRESYHSFDVRIDTRRPVTRAPRAATVRKGKVAALKYKVIDTGSVLGTTSVTIKVANRRGKVVKTLALGDQPVARLLTARFKWRLGRGRYRFSVYATDAAGNTQRVIGRNLLRVR